MQGNRSVIVDEGKKLSFLDQGKEIFKIKEMSVQTVQKPKIVFQNFQKNGHAFESSANDVSVTVDLHEESGVVAFSFGGSIHSKEDNKGYPVSLTMNNSLEVSLAIKENASFMANYQHKAWWIRPAFGTVFSEIPEKTQLLVLKKEEVYEIYLAVCGKENRADLVGTTDGIKISISSNMVNQRAIQDLAMIYGRGENPYEVIEKCMKLAMKLKNNSFMLRKQKRYPAIFENIGWCTWDSLGQDVSEEAIFKKMDEFQKKNIIIPWVLIDDGWSYVDKEHMTLKSLDADPVKFPNGIAGTVKVLKEKYHVLYVGVWQAFKGYWNGLEEDTEAYHIMAPYITKYGSGEIAVKATEEDAFGFWNRWHSELRQKGIDFVKVDGQSSFPLMTSGISPYGTSMRGLYTGLEASVFLNFDGNLINCMGMAPENVWNRCNSAISRTSDDYTPTVSGSFAEHVLQNCYNSVYHGDIYYGDWDMFWSNHEDTVQSSILRVISGGPVYISDACGYTEKKELNKIIRPNGSLMKCNEVGKPMLDCLTEDTLHKGKILKICNECNKSIFIACFTWYFPEKKVDGIISLKDIPNRECNRYWVYDWHTHKLGKCNRDNDYFFSMEPKEAKMLELVPEENDIAVLGMIDKYIASAGIDFVRWFENICFVKVNCSGIFGFITIKGVECVYINDKEVSYEKEDELHQVEVRGENAEIAIVYKK